MTDTPSPTAAEREATLAQARLLLALDDGTSGGRSRAILAVADALAASRAPGAVCRDALEEILEYRGGADSALEDPYVMERARAALGA